MIKNALMAFSRLIVLAAAAVAGLLMLAGCGGLFPQGCGGADFGKSNPEFAGSYHGTYTGNAASGHSNDLSFDLEVDSMGNITGSVTEVAGRGPASVTGHLMQWEDPCATDRVYLDTTFSFSEGDTRTLTAGRKITPHFGFPFDASYSSSGGVDASTLLGKGSLVLTKQIP